VEESIIYKDIDKLCTPVGEFVVVAESGERIRFSVRKNYYDVPYEVGEDSEHVTGTIQTDTNYCIIIDSNKLQVGTNYKVFFSAGLWEFNDSDEHTNCYSTVSITGSLELEHMILTMKKKKIRGGLIQRRWAILISILFKLHHIMMNQNSESILLRLWIN